MKKTLFTTLLILAANSAVAFDLIKYRVEDRAKYIQGALGFGRGGIALGADYEMGIDQDLTWGGQFRYYTENTATGVSAPKIIHIGAFIRPHWVRGAWDFYTSPGAGLSFVSNPTKSETLITPTIAFGTSYAFTQALTIGVETTTIYGITSDSFRGEISQDYMFKMRFRID